MNTREDFLQAICAEPDDDDLRRVYADWLEENGHADYADFIRVQCSMRALAEATKDQRLLSLITRRRKMLECLTTGTTDSRDVGNTDDTIDQYVERHLEQIDVMMQRVKERMLYRKVRKGWKIGNNEGLQYSRGVPTVFAYAKNIPSILSHMPQESCGLSIYARNPWKYLPTMIQSPQMAKAGMLRLESKGKKMTGPPDSLPSLAASSHAKDIRILGIYNLGPGGYQTAAEAERVREDHVLPLLEKSALPRLEDMFIHGAVLDTAALMRVAERKQNHPSLRRIWVKENMGSFQEETVKQLKAIGIDVYRH